LQKFAAENGNQTRVYSFPNSGDVPDFETAYKSDSFKVAQNELAPGGWRLEQTNVLDLLAKLRSKGKPLGEYVSGRFYYGIKTGLNEAFVVDQATKERLIAEDSSSAEVLKPYLRGRNVKRWKVSFDDLWLIYIPWHFPLHNDKTIKGASEDAEREFERHYPAIYKHLSKFRKELSARNKSETGINYEWYALQRWGADHWQEFYQHKIIYPDIVQTPQFAWDETGSLLANTLYFIPTNSKFLLSFLNSKALTWFYLQLSPQIRGGYVRYIAQYVEQIPIPTIEEKDQQPFVALVDQILELKKESKDTEALENEIDTLVYRLYDLTDEEIAIVEGK
jgi:hypothetical protein